MAEIQVERFIQTTPDQVYHAFTNATALREWLCDVATVVPQVGGRVYLWWNGNFFSSGEYKLLDPDRRIILTWLGRNEPHPTEINIALTPQNGGTLVRLTHTTPDGESWKGALKGFEKEWQASFENLASVLTSGMDLRIVNRPMLGITVNDFNSEIAAQIGVPVTEGLRLAGTLEGMGAHAAGLRQDDVIVEMDNQPIDNSFTSLTAALENKIGGDKVKVIFYRGNQKKSVIMELSRRPIPDIPWEPGELAEQVRVKAFESLERLTASFEGVKPEEAAYKPSTGDWSADEVIAHLIHVERGLQNFIAELITGNERWADGFGQNIQAQVEATVLAYPKTQTLLEELKRLTNETIAFIQRLPPEFVARKGSYVRLAWNLLVGTTHTDSHIAQINAAIQAAREN